MVSGSSGKMKTARIGDGSRSRAFQPSLRLYSGSVAVDGLLPRGVHGTDVLQTSALGIDALGTSLRALLAYHSPIHQG